MHRHSPEQVLLVFIDTADIVYGKVYVTVRCLSACHLWVCSCEPDWQEISIGNKSVSKIMISDTVNLFYELLSAFW